MASYLVVANRTLGGAELGDRLRELIAAQPAPMFVVLVPVTIPVAMDVGGAMGGIAVIDVENYGYVERMAQERLGAVLSWLHEAGSRRPARSLPVTPSRLWSKRVDPVASTGSLFRRLRRDGRVGSGWTLSIARNESSISRSPRSKAPKPTTASTC